MQQWIDSIQRFIAVPADNAELLKAQYRAYSRQMPIMYSILISCTWTVATTHMAVAPSLLTIAAPLLLSIGSAARMRHWWRLRHVDPSPEVALQALRSAKRISLIVAMAFTAWTILLFEYGNSYTHSRLAFDVAITAISCVFCLMHLGSAAIAAMVILNGLFLVFFCASGEVTPVATVTNTLLVSGCMLGILSIYYRDFARMVNAQAEARRREEAQSRLLRMIDDMPIAVMTVDPETFRVNYANETSKDLIRSIEHLLPIKADDLIGTSVDVFHRRPEHQRRILGDPANLPHGARIQLGPEVLDVKVSAITGSDGSYLGPMQTWAIVTAEVERERRILQLAHYDTLTGLANRTRFNEKLEESLATPSDRTGLIFIDLDGFKLVNDTRGHGVGDDLLRKVADRLRNVCHCSDMMIGRIGGDEFAVLVPHRETSEIERLAVLIIDALSISFEFDQDRPIQIGASIGIACAPVHGETGEALLTRADIALYAAKTAGKGTHKLFSEDMEGRIQERMRLQTELQKSLQTNEGMFVFYQPIIDIQTKRVTAREALVRWHHPQMGWISPAEFVPVAEQGGLIDQLGEFVLQTACRDAMEWHDDARVAVNVSAAQLGKGKIVETVVSALIQSGLSPNRLEIEVTETAIFDEEGSGIGDLRRIRDLGIRVALDDFGTGYSSLTHLRSFPFDKIKIDGSFVKDAVERRESAAVVRAIADLGKRLGVTTVAEGVETEAHLNRVLDEGCDEAQGYFYGRPVPSERDAAIVAEINASIANGKVACRVATNVRRLAS